METRKDKRIMGDMNMQRRQTIKYWISVLLVAVVASGLLATLLDVGVALASVSWNG